MISLLPLVIQFVLYLFDLFQAQRGLVESSHKLDILKLSLEKRLRELPTGSPSILQIREELATGKSEVRAILGPILSYE